jgi:quinolinate synthase
MQRITLPKVARALETLSPEVVLDAAVLAGARRALDRMLAVGRREAA